MRLSDYWSVLLLAVAAVAFLLAGAPLTKEAAAGAGFALAGAAITRMVDVTQERRREQAAVEERRRTDLDETRRVAYRRSFQGDQVDGEVSLLLRAHRHPGECACAPRTPSAL
jgi:hypothetical protein